MVILPKTPLKDRISLPCEWTHQAGGVVVSQCGEQRHVGGSKGFQQLGLLQINTCLPPFLSIWVVGAWQETERLGGSSNLVKLHSAGCSLGGLVIVALAWVFHAGR